MAQLTGAERANYVQNLFTQIASRYDVMNRLMTFGQDTHWRARVVALAQVPANGSVLDLGAGTGDIALELAERTPTARVVGGDFTLAMMRVGQRRPGGQHLRWSGTDALNLPFPDATFDAVVSGYLMRNVGDLSRAWAEQWRVLKPGGRVVCLDTTPPARNLLRPFIEFHLHTVIPTLGQLITGTREAYTYLPNSTEGFLPAEKLAERMRAAGFETVRFERWMLGTMAIHYAVKPLA
ncbi:MAG: ubiquinone/menaquinone biosynthesis methyltransferase [Anaerolineales bacterium]|nr:ubiquinone/menaquinone biosynthesis methyltransferase [Anaerolineales bacterium]